MDSWVDYAPTARGGTQTRDPGFIDRRAKHFTMGALR